MAENSLQCAGAIIETLSGSDQSMGDNWVGVGIGINTGPVYVGSIGSETLKDYTVVGNTVNIAARLCGYANKFQIIFSEHTKKFIEDEDLSYRSTGKKSLKGIRNPIKVFELMKNGIAKNIGWITQRRDMEKHNSTFQAKDFNKTTTDTCNLSWRHKVLKCL